MIDINTMLATLWFLILSAAAGVLIGGALANGAPKPALEPCSDVAQGHIDSMITRYGKQNVRVGGDENSAVVAAIINGNPIEQVLFLNPGFAPGKTPKGKVRQQMPNCQNNTAIVTVWMYLNSIHQQRGI